MVKNKEVLVVFGILLVVGLIGVVFATFDSSAEYPTTNYTTTEDAFYSYNLSANITGFNNDINFTIDSDTKIKWANSSTIYSVDKSLVASWLRIYDVDTGNLTINATQDNQTGWFRVVVQTFNTTSNTPDDLGTFSFIVNATNDYPNFTQIDNNYTLRMSNPYTFYVNASDEENHWPLIFNITFYDNCTHAPFTGRNVGENCSIMNFTFYDNETGRLSMAPTSDDVGRYWANITVTDAGENYNSSAYPYQEANYSENRTYQYTSTVYFEVQANLDINATNCTNRIFQEGTWDWCLINITTQGASDNLNVSSYSILRNYPAGQSDVQNTSWFYADSSTNSVNNVKTINASFTPGKTEVGNWTINFSVNDTTLDQYATEQIYVYVNRTNNDVPEVDDVSDVVTSVNLLTVINFSVYDDDLMIPDKNDFDEDINFTLDVYNQSTLVPTSISNFNITILDMPVSGTNKTTAEIRWTPLGVDSGNYTINVTINDSEDASTYVTFNLSILNNSRPVWDNLLTTTFVIYEDNNTYLNLSLNASDPDGDPLTFSYFNDTQFNSFIAGAGSDGIIDFNASDVDIGQHLVNITISDGYLSNTTQFNFTILNLNDNISIRSLQVENASPTGDISSGGSVNATEDNYTTFELILEDDDLKIPMDQKSFYNESFTFDLTIEGVNESLFNFSINDGWWPQPETMRFYPNQTRYLAIFTPRNGDIGNYNITINFSDSGGSYDVFSFNLSVLAIPHDPVMSSVSNLSSAVNRTLYYDVNVTDVEDGNDTTGTLNTNFTFSYVNLSGKDIFSGGFNSTTGVFNTTFNDSQDGKYHINISVNDSSGLIDYDDFWVYVYSPPTVISPSAGFVFNLTENVTSVLNFTVNHSIGDNLTYDFYVDSVSYNGSSYSWGSLVLRDRSSYYGNATSYNFSFTPTISDETYGQVKNLTLVVYTNSSDLINNTLVNTTINFKLNISHSNAPVVLYDDIDDLGPTAYTSDITIDLSDHFSDEDYDDSNYDEVVSFTLHGNTSEITSSISGSWILTLSASAATFGSFNVTASDGETNATSGNFVVVFNNPPTSNTGHSSSSSSSTKEVPVSLKILMPDPVSAYKKDYIELPITLYNNGDETLRVIKLSGSVAKDGVLAEDVKINFSESEFDVLTKGQRKNTTMYLAVNTERNGTFEITVNATVQNPDYDDWGKMFLTIKEGEKVDEKILFVEEFIVENPECLELKEVIDEAKNLMNSGKSSEAYSKADEAINACRELIAQNAQGKEKAVQEEDPIYRYLIASTIVVFFIGVGFYSYKRIRYARKKGSYLQESIKTKKYM